MSRRPSTAHAPQIVRLDETAPGHAPRASENLDREALSEVVDLALWAGHLLMENGAETERVEQTVRDCGNSLGCDWSNVLVTYNAIIVTHVGGGDFRTKMRRVRPKTVNMSLIEEISHLTHRAREGKLTRAQLRRSLARAHAEPRHYPPTLVTLAVALACAAFSRLFHGDAGAFALTFVGTTCGMVARGRCAKIGLNTFLVTALTAAVASSVVAGLEALTHLSSTPRAAIAACALMLVPGVPAINATEDLIKSHTSVGVARAAEASLVVLAATLGLLLGQSVPWGVP